MGDDADIPSTHKVSRVELMVHIGLNMGQLGLLTFSTLPQIPRNAVHVRQ
jgi:hypothetical protein